MANDIEQMKPRTGRIVREDNTVVNEADALGGGRTVGQSAAAVTAPYNPGHSFFVESNGSGSVSVVYADGTSGTIPAIAFPDGRLGQYPVLCTQITAATATTLRAVKPLFL